MNFNKLLLKAIGAAIQAGADIMKVYDSDFAIEHKDDKSPLTLADKKSHETIAGILIKTDIPILSEEGKDIPYHTRKSWDYFWMVDPLDGTKEFINRNGEFTVNIALIHKQKPVQGIIYVPVLKTLYFASESLGSFRMNMMNQQYNSFHTIKNIIYDAQKLSCNITSNKYRIVASRSHMSPETMTFIEKQKAIRNDIELVTRGSSLKFCMIAEGEAHVYPRFGPTMEWDTAAGNAIVEFAGGRITQTDFDSPLNYNKKNLLNPWFIVYSKFNI